MLMMVVGVDGCKAGWFTVSLTEEGHFDIDVFAGVSALWKKHNRASVILIDIPIGLKESGSQERLCDIEARRLLGPRQFSVFRVPCRAAIYAKTYEEACSINERNTGKRLSRQIWNIALKIREVDMLLSNSELVRLSFRETHPELCFWALAGGHPMKHPKRTEAGFSERKQLLQSVYPQANEIVSYALDTYRPNQVKEDDILDALVAAVTATAGQEKLVSIPEPPQFDSRGLRMEMVYCRKEELKR